MPRSSSLSPSNSTGSLGTSSQMSLRCISDVFRLPSGLICQWGTCEKSPFIIPWDSVIAALSGGGDVPWG